MSQAARDSPGRLVFTDDLTTVWNGDARSLPVEDGAATCVVTSPPYNVGLAYDVADDTMPWDDYRALGAALPTQRHA